MKIVFNDNLASVMQATDKANAMLNDDRFYSQIKSHSSFDLSTASPSIVADLIKSSSLQFAVEIFYPNIFRLPSTEKHSLSRMQDFPTLFF